MVRDGGWVMTVEVQTLIYDFVLKYELLYNIGYCFFVNILQQAGLHENYRPLSRKPVCRDVLNPRLP